MPRKDRYKIVHRQNTNILDTKTDNIIYTGRNPKALAHICARLNKGSLTAKSLHRYLCHGRASIINQWIEDRKEKGERPTECIFNITVPKNIDLHEDETIRKVKEIFDRNHVSYSHVDTMPGAWNLNRDWLETGHINCIVEYCGVYPVDWNIMDVVELERMENDGEIIIRVVWIVNGEYVENH